MAGLFSWLGNSSKNERLPEIFPMAIKSKVFVEIDCQTIFSRILTDVLKRTEGLTDDEQVLLWDNCLGSESQDGLVTLLAKAMVAKSDLFVVYFPELKVIRKAKNDEETKIREGYKLKGEPVKLDGGGVGVFITIKNYRISDMIQLYSALEYCGVNSFWKSMNLSKALQLKFNELRSSTGLTDSTDVKKQAIEMAQALSEGLDIYCDAKDILELLKPDLEATNSAMELIAQKRSFYLGLPASYITGVATKGLGDTGQGDARKIEEGLSAFFFSIIKPVCDGIFSKKTTFESDDFAQISSSMEVMKTFEATGEEIVSLENKTLIMNRMLGLPKDAKGDPPPKVDPLTGLPPGQLPPPGQPPGKPGQPPPKDPPAPPTKA